MVALNNTIQMTVIDVFAQCRVETDFVFGLGRLYSAVRVMSIYYST